MRRKILIGLASCAALVLLYLLLWPVPVDPVAWTPPEPPALSGAYAPNTRLSEVKRLPPGAGYAPEDVAIDGAGRIYTGVEDGRIFRLRADGAGAEVFADTRGRPLGLRFDAANNLIVADAAKGLLSVAPDGSVSVLSTEAGGVPFRCTNDLDIASDGTIYFTDASSKFPLSALKADLIEHRPNGRLLAYDPRTGQTRVVLDGLYFANGVALSPDQTFVLVSETGAYRVRRLWLSGERRGQSDIFIENLPGFPDNISSNGGDKFWLALVSPRNRLLDATLPRPLLGKVLLRLPNFLQPAPARYGFVLGLSQDGRVIANLQDPSGKSFALVSSALEHDGQLYLGSIGEDAVGRLPLR